MRIKSVEIVGFKSFYNSTSVIFHPGINALVGPNGCGKSNVLDSIKWVLGEQNPRRLRAEGMEQVISAGGDSLKPLAMAEVALNLEDARDGGFEEIEVKRRLFRSGESEYFINGVPSRLRDITEMFMDTGTGARAYSVVDQGKIEQIITYKPEDRRSMVEEVAGIQKYKLRRRETQSRIHSTEENLGRVSDLIREVGRQMNSLSQQAKRAEEFKRVSKDARLLELALTNRSLEELERRRKGLEEGISALRDRTAGKEALMRECEEALRGAEEGVLAREGSVEQALEHISALRDQIQRRRSEVEVSKSEIVGADDYISRQFERVELLRGEAAALESQIGEKQRARESIGNEIAQRGLELEQSEGSLARLREEFAKYADELDSIRREVIETLDKESNLKALAHGLEREIAELGLREERGRKEMDEAREESGRVRASLEELNEALGGYLRRRSEAAGKRDAHLEDLSNLKNARGALERELNSLGERIGGCDSRLGALRQIDQSYEWLPEEVRSFILEGKRSGVLGIVADFVSAPKGYERALEAALGEKLGWVLVSDEGAAVEALAHMLDRSVGRVTLLPASTPLGYEPSPAPLPEGVERLPEIIALTGDHQPLIRGLLADVFVVGSLDEALEMRKRLDGGAEFVTLGGELVDSLGAITGGVFSAQGVFERRREIEELEGELRVLRERKSSMSQRLMSSEREIEGLEGAIESLEASLVEVEIGEREARKDIANLTEQLTRLERRSELLGLDLEQVASETGEKRGRLEAACSEIGSLESARLELEQRHAELREVARGEELRQREMESAITSLRVDRASLAEKRRGIEEDINDLESRLADTRAKIERETEEIDRNRVRKRELAATLSEARAEIERLEGEREEQERRLDGLRRERSELISTASALKAEKEDHLRVLSQLREESNALLLEANRVEIEIDHLREGREEIGGFLSEDELARADAEEFLGEGSVEQAQERLSRLRDRLEGFGAVNLLAPEEYERLQERHRFLSEQVRDLTEALDSLERAMKKIDRESERRFLEGFELLDSKFRTVFARLFRGGEAKLALTDPDSLLETGVDVMIRPRGKRFQSVSLLSGGEKALSAIALIISASLIRPVPFLLLDEIDGPLDDTNTAQFVDLLREVSDITQVIIVTHNKRTMQYSSSLVGITSESPGTSRVVSVELNDGGGYERSGIGIV